MKELDQNVQEGTCVAPFHPALSATQEGKSLNNDLSMPATPEWSMACGTLGASSVWLLFRWHTSVSTLARCWHSLGLCAAWLLNVAQTSPNNSTGCSCAGHWPLGMHPAWSLWCYTVPARLPATLQLLAKPTVNVALTAVIYGSLNLISLLYLPLPILSFLSASLAASWQGLIAC